MLYKPLLPEDPNLLWPSVLLGRPGLLPRPVLPAARGVLRHHLLPGRVPLLSKQVRGDEAVGKQSVYNLIRAWKRRAVLGTVFAQIGLICLAGVAWTQDAVLPQRMAPSIFPAPVTSSVLPADRPGRRYVIAKDDLLNIDVVGVQELSREYRVDGDGMITLPMLSRPVTAAGLTLDQLSQVIRNDLLEAGLLRDAQVTVSVKSSPWNTVVLSGAAKKTGVYPVYGHTTLLELLTEAEGLSDDAGSTAIVTRAGSEPARPEPNPARAAPDTQPALARTLRVDVWRLWQNGDASLNVDLYPGDRVMIQRAGIVYVLGAVNRAGGFVLSGDQDQMTVLRAIALAGNFTREAKPAKAVIIRKTSHPAAERQEVRVDLKKVLTNQAPDQQLLASDILYIPESGAKRTLDTVINTAVYTTIWRMPY